MPPTDTTMDSEGNTMSYGDVVEITGTVRDSNAYFVETYIGKNGIVKSIRPGQYPDGSDAILVGAPPASRLYWEVTASNKRLKNVPPAVRHVSLQECIANVNARCERALGDNNEMRGDIERLRAEVRVMRESAGRASTYDDTRVWGRLSHFTGSLSRTFVRICRLERESRKQNRFMRRLENFLKHGEGIEFSVREALRMRDTSMPEEPPTLGFATGGVITNRESRFMAGFDAKVEEEPAVVGKATGSVPNVQQMPKANIFGPEKGVEFVQTDFSDLASHLVNSMIREQAEKLAESSMRASRDPHLTSVGVIFGDDYEHQLNIRWVPGDLSYTITFRGKTHERLCANDVLRFFRDLYCGVQP